MSRPATDDPFATLGLPHTFRLDPARLRAVHVRLMATAHPDRATSPVEAAEFARRAAAINEAQRRLADPLGRAEALFAALGASPSTGSPLPADFLMEAMELREALDEAIAEGDESRAASLLDDATARRDAQLEEIAERFDRALASEGAARESELAGARDALSRLRYVMRLIGRATEAARGAPGVEG